MAALVLLFGTSPTANAEDIDLKKGKLERLAPCIGTYKYEQVLNDPDVAQSLNKVTSVDKFRTIRENMEVRGPIDFEDGNLVLRGNRPHQGMTELAIVEIEIYVEFEQPYVMTERYSFMLTTLNIDISRGAYELSCPAAPLTKFSPKM
jgi:hypothetical protein